MKNFFHFCLMTTKNITLEREARAWLKRRSGADEIINVVPALEEYQAVKTYHLYTAYEAQPEFLGSILFDSDNNWIYNGTDLSITEQEQMAAFIINYQERL